MVCGESEMIRVAHAAVVEVGDAVGAHEEVVLDGHVEGWLRDGLTDDERTARLGKAMMAQAELWCGVPPSFRPRQGRRTPASSCCWWCGSSWRS